MEDLGQYHARTRSSRSKAWVYYSIITVLVVVGTVAAQAWAALLIAAVTGAYARYLYRGGKFVLWIW